jgi:hypothetical protein
LWQIFKKIAFFHLYKNLVMQRYVTLGVPWVAGRWQENSEKVRDPQTATRCQET